MLLQVGCIGSRIGDLDEIEKLVAKRVPRPVSVPQKVA
jgi:hypothetical protein